MAQSGLRNLMTRRLRHAAWDVLSAYEEDAALVRRVVDEIWNAGDIVLADELFSSTNRDAADTA
jgi:hypothetical protein